MSLELRVTGVEDFKAAQKRFLADLQRDLRRSFKSVAERLLSRAVGGIHPGGSGKLESSGRSSSWASAKSAGIHVWFDNEAAGTPPYGSWVEYGLALRPVHERARSRRGIVNPLLGRSRTGHKPWGIEGRHFLQTAAQATIPEAVTAAEQVLADAISGFNNA